jgi:hypothetical protein
MLVLFVAALALQCACMPTRRPVAASIAGDIQSLRTVAARRGLFGTESTELDQRAANDRRNAIHAISSGSNAEILRAYFINRAEQQNIQRKISRISAYAALGASGAVALAFPPMIPLFVIGVTSVATGTVPFLFEYNFQPDFVYWAFRPTLVAPCLVFRNWCVILDDTVKPSAF